MPTLKQKNLADAIVQNIRSKNPKNKKELLVSVGYTLNTAEAKAGEIISQKGVQNELKNLGFTEEGAKQVVQEILYNSEEEGSIRLRAASEVFKVFGTYAAEKTFNLTATTSIDELKQRIQKDLVKFRAIDLAKFGGKSKYD